MNLSTPEGVDALVKRARLQNLAGRADDLEDVRAMLNGTYSPPEGWIAPGFDRGSTREEAWKRALRTVTPAAPLVISKAVAGLDFGSVTWSDAEGNQNERINEEVGRLDLGSLARSAAIEYRIGGVIAMMASVPELDDETPSEPVLTMLRGVNVPYTDPRDHSTITGWYRAVQYVDPESAKLVWWVEIYDFADDGKTVHRIWRRLDDPIELGGDPEEFESTARPRFAIYDLQPDGLPVSPVLANMGRIMGLYASELRLSAAEEMSAFPMLLLRGNPEWDSISPSSAIVVDEGGGAEWLAPGDLEQLREQVRLKRDQVREAFNLPGGSLGAQTPSGEALAEANRGFMQESHRTADAISRVLSDTVSDYLALLGLPPVDVIVPIDRAYTAATELEIVQAGLDYNAIPAAVAARKFQQFMGSAAYSDEELKAFLGVERDVTGARETGELFAGDDPAVE